MDGKSGIIAKKTIEILKKKQSIGQTLVIIFDDLTKVDYSLNLVSNVMKLGGHKFILCITGY